MKKIIIACLLAIISASAFAEWTLVFKLEEIDFYIDYQTIRKEGSTRKVWEIQDLKQRHKDGEMSRRFRTEYNCKDERFRFLAASEHYENMGLGNTLSDSSYTGKWGEIPPNSAAEKILKIVCSK